MRTTLPHALLVLSLASVVLPSRAADERCGDPPYDECGPGEFCARVTGFCEAPYPFGVCKATGVNCTAEWNPVCGCDFQVYSNYCSALSAGVSVARHGSACGYACGPGSPCGAGWFCFTGPGQCSGPGTCLEKLEPCSTICSPVCACDGRTYTNSCQAHLAGVGVDHFGFCGHPEQLMIDGAEFGADGFLIWREHPEALAYNVYREAVSAGFPSGVMTCHAANLPHPELQPTGEPIPGELWSFLVSGVFESGEGPLGIAVGCAPRQAAEPCGGSFAAGVGPRPWAIACGAG